MELVREAAQTSRTRLKTDVGDLLDRLMSGNIVEHALTDRARASYDLNENLNPYEQAVLNILLRSDSQKVPLFMRTIEDYMWFKLSFCTDQHTCSSVLEKLQCDVRNFRKKKLLS